MRRRSREQTITLFSFQDIITGVAGVMLFILLLLVVQLTLRSAVALENETPKETSAPTPVETQAAVQSFPEMQQDLEQMREELEQLKIQNEALMRASSRNLDAEIRAAQNAINDLIRAGDETKDQAKQLADDIASQEVSQQRKNILDRKQKLKNELEQLAEQEQRHASGKLVAFKTTNKSSGPMWVVDLRDMRASLFDVQAPSKVIDVAYQREMPASAIVGQIKKKLQESSKTRNIILLLRPSVAGRGNEFMDSFRSGGFRVALELLDEDTLVTEPVEAGGKEPGEEGQP